MVGPAVEDCPGLVVVGFDSSYPLRRGVLCVGSSQHDRLVASQPMGVVDVLVAIREMSWYTCAGEVIGILTLCLLSYGFVTPSQQG